MTSKKFFSVFIFLLHFICVCVGYFYDEVANENPFSVERQPMHRERSANSPSSNSKISSMNTDNNIDEEENSNDDRSSYIANENPIIIDDTSHSSEEYDYENRPSISSLTSEYNYVVDQVVKKTSITDRFYGFAAMTESPGFEEAICNRSVCNIPPQNQGYTGLQSFTIDKMNSFDVDDHDDDDDSFVVVSQFSTYAYVIDTNYSTGSSIIFGAARILDNFVFDGPPADPTAEFVKGAGRGIAKFDSICGDLSSNLLKNVEPSFMGSFLERKNFAENRRRHLQRVTLQLPNCVLQVGKPYYIEFIFTSSDFKPVFVARIRLPTLSAFSGSSELSLSDGILYERNPQFDAYPIDLLLQKYYSGEQLQGILEDEKNVKTENFEFLSFVFGIIVGLVVAALSIPAYNTLYSKNSKSMNVDTDSPKPVVGSAPADDIEFIFDQVYSGGDDTNIGCISAGKRGSLGSRNTRN